MDGCLRSGVLLLVSHGSLLFSLRTFVYSLNYFINIQESDKESLSVIVKSSFYSSFMIDQFIRSSPLPDSPCQLSSFSLLIFLFSPSNAVHTLSPS